MRLAGETRSRIVEEIVSVSRTPGIAGIQIDFDALKSQRAFYRGLLLELREKLPSGLKLSITALASWCVFDDWISDLPIDEAVPMLFRLGAGEEEIGRYLAQGNDFRAAICKHSVGISTDEPFPKLRARRRVYVFNPHRWDAASLRAVMKKVEVTQ